MSRRRLATVSGQKIILLSIFLCFGIGILWIFEPVQRWDEGRNFLTHSQKVESECRSFSLTKFDLGHIEFEDRFPLEFGWLLSADRSIAELVEGANSKSTICVAFTTVQVSPSRLLAIPEFDFDLSPSHRDRVPGGNKELWTVVDSMEMEKYFIYVGPATRGDAPISGIGKRTGARWDDGASRLSKEVPSAKIGSRPDSIFSSFTVPSSLRQQWIDDFMAHVLETSADFAVVIAAGHQPHSESGAGTGWKIHPFSFTRPKCLEWFCGSQHAALMLRPPPPPPPPPKVDGDSEAVTICMEHMVGEVRAVLLSTLKLAAALFGPPACRVSLQLRCPGLGPEAQPLRHSFPGPSDLYYSLMARWPLPPLPTMGWLKYWGSMIRPRELL